MNVTPLCNFLNTRDNILCENLKLERKRKLLPTIWVISKWACCKRTIFENKRLWTNINIEQYRTQHWTLGSTTRNFKTLRQYLIKLWIRFKRKYLKHCNAVPSTPISFFIISRSLSTSIVSKAALRSNTTMMVARKLSNPRSTSSVNSNIIVSVEWYFL